MTEQPATARYTTSYSTILLEVTSHKNMAAKMHNKIDNKCCF